MFLDATLVCNYTFPNIFLYFNTYIKHYHSSKSQKWIFLAILGLKKISNFSGKEILKNNNIFIFYTLFKTHIQKSKDGPFFLDTYLRSEHMTKKALSRFTLHQSKSVVTVTTKK